MDANGKVIGGTRLFFSFWTQFSSSVKFVTMLSPGPPALPANPKHFGASADEFSMCPVGAQDHVITTYPIDT